MLSAGLRDYGQNYNALQPYNRVVLITTKTGFADASHRLKMVMRAKKGDSRKGLWKKIICLEQ
jgi:hypothetical protein